MSVGFFLPHVPCYATQKWFDLYPEQDLVLPPLRRDDRDDTPRFSWYLHWKLPEPRFRFLEEASEWKNLVRSYLACVSFVDSQVGRVLVARSRRAGQADDTRSSCCGPITVGTSARRASPARNTLWERFDASAVDLRGTGGRERGRSCAEPAELLDMYPTLIDLCGFAPRGMDSKGHSLVPQLRRTPRRNASPWPAITTHNQGNHSVRRSNDWRYIRYADGSEELYDLDSDPNEWTNLAGRPGHAARLSALRAWLPSTNVKPAPGAATGSFGTREDEPTGKVRTSPPTLPSPSSDAAGPRIAR